LKIKLWKCWICDISKIYVPRKFVRVRYIHITWSYNTNQFQSTSYEDRAWRSPSTTLLYQTQHALQTPLPIKIYMNLIHKIFTWFASQQQTVIGYTIYGISYTRQPPHDQVSNTILVWVCVGVTKDTLSGFSIKWAWNHSRVPGIIPPWIELWL